MDEIKQLEKEIQRLEVELRQQKSEESRMRQALANEYGRRLQEYESQMKYRISEYDRNVKVEYERLLNKYERSMNYTIQEQKLRMDRNYQQLLQSVKQKEVEWSEKTKQLENCIAELKRNINAKNTLSISETRKYMNEAMEAYRLITEKPHEKFFPGRLALFKNTIEEAERLSNNGLHEAAIATLISAKVGLNRLGYDIDEKVNEWKSQYQLFKGKVHLVSLKLTDEISIWCDFTGNRGQETKDLSDDEKNFVLKNLNYWTKGDYGEINARISTFDSVVRLIEKKGINNYLKKEESVSVDDLRRDVVEIDEMNEKLEKSLVMYKRRYTASCERYDWGKRIIDFFRDEINLNWVEDESHFKNIDEDKRNKKDYVEYMTLLYGQNFEKVDTREWLELVFSNAMNEKIFIYIVPHECEDERDIKNRIVAYVDFIGTVNEAYSRSIYSHICESIGINTSNGNIDFAADVTHLTRNADATLRATGKSIETKIQRINNV